MNKFFQVSSIVDEFVFAREGAAKGNGGLKGFTYDAWTSNEKSWKQGKHLITREPVLKYFDPSKEVTLQCDASESGLGAVILQDGQPIAFSSTAFTSIERNYAQIEKELLSIVHGCTRFHQYVYGRPINYSTDTSQAAREHFQEISALSPQKAPKNVFTSPEV